MMTVKDKPGKDRKARDEHGLASRTKQAGHPPQRKLLHKRLDDLSDRSIMGATHGEEESLESRASPPRDDRAG